MKKRRLQFGGGIMMQYNIKPNVSDQIGLRQIETQESADDEPEERLRSEKIPWSVRSSAPDEIMTTGLRF
jgi:hypothetical protein